MSSRTREPSSFFNWIARPQSIIALSALLLSLCGLFIAVYEASLIRREQRTSVWPYVEVSVSVSDERVLISVRNAGVGPARIRAAAVSRAGETMSGWAELLRQVGAGAEPVDYYYSLLQGRVLPRDSEEETIFRIGVEGGPAAQELLAPLRREILGGSVDVTLCYCSVYDECWTASLQYVMRRTRGAGASVEDHAVASCEAAPRSGI